MRLEYTEQAQEVLAVMEETAHQMKFSYIGTEHLLYGMLSCPWVTAWKILAENGADESFVLKYLEQNSGTPIQLSHWSFAELLLQVRPPTFRTQHFV